MNFTTNIANERWGQENVIKIDPISDEQSLQKEEEIVIGFVRAIGSWNHRFDPISLFEFDGERFRLRLPFHVARVVVRIAYLFFTTTRGRRLVIIIDNLR